MTIQRHFHTHRAVAAIAAIALVVAGCGGGSDSNGSTDPTEDATPTTDSSSAEADPSLNEMLPSEIQQAGELKLGTEAYYPPFESFEEGTNDIVGLDVDLAEAMGSALGVEVTFTNTAFAGLLTALTAGRFDAVMSAITDTKERQAQYDFLDYFTTGQAILVAKGNPEGITAIEDLCGKAISVLVSSTQEDLLNGFNAEECAGNEIDISAFPSDKDALLQVQSGRAQASFTQDAVGRYNATSAGGGSVFEVANSEPILPIPVGMVFNKEDTELRDAMQAALKAIIESGAYDEILANYDLSGGALKTAPINSGTS